MPQYLLISLPENASAEEVKSKIDQVKQKAQKFGIEIDMPWVTWVTQGAVSIVYIAKGIQKLYEVIMFIRGWWQGRQRQKKLEENAKKSQTIDTGDPRATEAFWADHADLNVYPGDNVAVIKLVPGSHSRGIVLGIGRGALSGGQFIAHRFRIGDTVAMRTQMECTGNFDYYMNKH
ncbi:hypothetical protein Ddc_16229 [Ditylenchus destructor]|nr:hypothetical protein Ddc_16229 [Ditylenchus destructor]